jgi:carbamoyltransferase
MLIVAPVRKKVRKTLTIEEEQFAGLNRLNIVRSSIPAVTHVDYSARIQTVTKEDHPQFYEIIAAFENRYGCPVMINTSFNVRGEPIVCTPHDAYLCFMKTDMDYLVMGNFLIDKRQQQPGYKINR